MSLLKRMAFSILGMLLAFGVLRFLFASESDTLFARFNQSAQKLIEQTADASRNEPNVQTTQRLNLTIDVNLRDLLRTTEPMPPEHKHHLFARARSKFLLDDHCRALTKDTVDRCVLTSWTTTPIATSGRGNYRVDAEFVVSVSQQAGANQSSSQSDRVAQPIIFTAPSESGRQDLIALGVEGVTAKALASWSKFCGDTNALDSHCELNGLTVDAVKLDALDWETNGSAPTVSGVLFAPKSSPLWAVIERNPNITVVKPQ